MMNQQSNWHKYCAGLVGLCLGLTFHAAAQQRAGGGFGGAARSAAASTTGGTTARPYPNNSAIGDAYFSIDPETRRVVFIADEATAKSMAQVLTNLDRPKPQVLIKVVFLGKFLNQIVDIEFELIAARGFTVLLELFLKFLYLFV